MADTEADPPQTIPVLKERLRVTRRAVPTDRIVLRKTVSEHEGRAELALSSETLSVERVPINRGVASAPAVREEGNELIVPVLEEIMVVETRLVLKEELRIRRTRATRTEQRSVPLRREAVVLEHPANPNPEENHVSTTQSANPLSPEGDATRQIVAMFETYQQARSARDKLVDSGIASGEIELLDRDAAPTDTTVPYERTSRGFWGAIKRLFVPEEDAHGYAEGLERGHAMLVVRPRPEQRPEVIRILESFDPIDFDKRQAEWREQGWAGVHAGAAMFGASTSGAPIPDPSTEADRRGVDAGTATFGKAGGAAVLDPTTEADRRGVDAGTATFGKAGGAAVPDPTTEAGRRGVDAGAATAGTPAPVVGTGTPEARPLTQAGSEADALVAGTEGLRGTSANREDVIPVVEERLRVGKREVAQGAVRVRSYVVERPVEEQVRLRQESVRVERHPADRPASEVPADAFRERTIEVQATGEEPVIDKEARVVEEVELHKDVGERTETVRDKTRRTEVKVDDERTNAPAAVTPEKTTGAAAGAKRR